MGDRVTYGDFEWDFDKDKENVTKHFVGFEIATLAFADPKGVLTADLAHSNDEYRFYFSGRVKDKILTVRFTLRGFKIRIIGAGFWRKGVKAYEEKNEKADSQIEGA